MNVDAVWLVPAEQPRSLLDPRNFEPALAVGVTIPGVPALVLPVGTLRISSQPLPVSVQVLAPARLVVIVPLPRLIATRSGTLSMSSVRAASKNFFVVTLAVMSMKHVVPVTCVQPVQWLNSVLGSSNGVRATRVP